MAKDSLAAALDAVAEPGVGGKGLKVLVLFGDRPDVLEAIIRARRDRRLSFAQIATVLSDEGKSVSSAAVAKWLAAEGVK